MPNTSKYINRELSWLSFNARVLQEARDQRVPLINRLMFLGIYSSNMDEFFRVRVASVKRLAELTSKTDRVLAGSPSKILQQVQDTVIRMRHIFDQSYKNILEALEGEGIYSVNEKTLSPIQESFVKEYFHNSVRPTLVPIMLDHAGVQFPMLRDKTVYLAVRLIKNKPNNKKIINHALIELPTSVIPRFLELPSEIPSKNYFILLDDVIRFNLREIFAVFDIDDIDAYTIKMTRDAELDIDDDVSESLLQKISKGIKQRRKGRPMRFIYDENMPQELYNYLFKRIGLSKNDAIIAGARYHNFKDFISFPTFNLKHLSYSPIEQLQHPALIKQPSIMAVLRKQDILLHYPYQTFNHVLDLLRESAIDPNVTCIKISLYRVAKNSNIVNALLNAIRNGKQVIVNIELQARFDEEANIFWSNRLREGGAKVIFGIPNMKVHSKLILIYRKERSKENKYAHIGTGNFNESTSKLYADHSLLTSNTAITNEVEKVFDFLENPIKNTSYRHLLVSPFKMRNQLMSLIEKEIKTAKEGKEAYMVLKMNSLADVGIIDKLYEASSCGVKIKLIVRGICSLKAGVEKLSENIEAISIVDKFLEHSRIYVFSNNSNPNVYIGSADWMTRNLDYRVEVLAPISNVNLRNELLTYLSLQLSDNVKARFIDLNGNNFYKVAKDNQMSIRCQDATFQYLKSGKLPFEEENIEIVFKNLAMQKNN